MLKWLQQYFEMRRWESIAIVVLMIAIVGAVAINYSIPYLVEDKLMPQKKLELISLAETIDSGANNNSKRYSESDGSNITPHKFNPSTCNREEFLSLGLSEKTVQVMLNYRNKGGQYRSKLDVKKIYAISSAEYARLAPYIDLPDSISANKFNTTKKVIASVEINTCDTAQLNLLPGIGAYTAQRIVDYRNKLGGFINVKQILECGVTADNFETAKQYLQCNAKRVKYVNVSTISFQELKMHPYCNEPMALAICKYRKTKGAIASIKELGAIEGVDATLFARLMPYLTLQ
jgi:competence protein ComEA